MLNAENTSFTRRTIRSALKAASVLFIALAVLLGPQVAANAAYTAGTKGRIGTIRLAGPMLTGSDYSMRLANGYYLNSRVFEADGFTVTRSPASTRPQNVAAIYYIQRLQNGSWVTFRQTSYTGTVSGAGTWRFPKLTFNPTQQPTSTGLYRTVYGVGWYDRSTGAQLGVTLIAPSTTSDSRCRTAWLRCTSYAGSVQF